MSTYNSYQKVYVFLILVFLSFSLGDCLHRHTESIAHTEGKVLLLSFVVWLHITAIRKFMSFLSLFFFLSFSLGDCLHRHTEWIAHIEGNVLLLSFVVCLHITAIRKFISYLSLFFCLFLLATAFIVTQN